MSVNMMRAFPKITMLIGLCLLNALIVDTFFPCRVESASWGTGHIEIQDLDFSAGVAKLLFVLDEETGSDDFRERSTTWLVIEQTIADDFGHGVDAFPIGRADPDWKLVETNNVTLWHWRLEKTFGFRYQSNGNPGVVFPFERLTMSFYIATNLSRSFTASIDVPNFSVAIEVQNVDSNQSSWTFQPEGCPYFRKVDLYVFHNFGYKAITMMVYILLFIIFLAAVLLAKKRNDIRFADFLRISSSLLIFLMVFLFTFRNSMVPKYLTMIDALCFLGALIYGFLMLWKLFRFKSEKSE